ncbi:MAG: hypothetical protein ABI681_13955 [Gemmatimonadales bacterium]
MRKVWSVSVALAALTILSSCNALDAISSAGRVRGTYELTNVNGSRVPAVVYQEPGYRLEVLNAAFTLEDDGSYTEAGIVRETVNGQTSTRSSSSYGYYDYYNGELTFDESGGRRYYGTLDGLDLVIEDQGVTMTYRRY